MLYLDTSVREFDDIASGVNYSQNLIVDDRKSESFDVTIFPMYKFPLTGFHLFIAPGIGYRFNKQKESYSLYYDYSDGSDGISGEYLLKPVGHAFILKCEVGTTVYISRFMELVFSIGIDGQVYSSYFNNVDVEKIHETITGTPAYPVEKIINNSQNNTCIGYYIKLGFNIRIF